MSEAKPDEVEKSAELSRRDSRDGSCCPTAEGQKNRPSVLRVRAPLECRAETMRVGADALVGPRFNRLTLTRLIKFFVDNAALYGIL